MMNAQTYQRRAALIGGGNSQSGKCTAEVVVDGAAEVEIRGDTAQIRNLSGQPAQWRRFECTGPLPAHPVDFRFQGIDGRGRQDLVRDPRNGGSAVVRIEDPDGGQEGYTFDITWGAGNGYFNNPNTAGDYRRGDAYRGDEYPWQGRVVNRDYAVNQAIGVCRDAVRQEATNRFHPGRVEVRDMRLDDNPGRRDWIVGVADVYRGRGREDRYRFSCSVNFDNGRVRNVQLEPLHGRGGYGYR
jgi:hypothetical protein